MKPHRVTEGQKVEATEQDIKMMSIVEGAFAASQKIKGGLKSMKKDIEPLVEHLVDKDRAITSLEDLFNAMGQPTGGGNIPYRYNRGNEPTNIESFLAALLISAIKNKNSRQGKAEPVYVEEVEWMLKRSGEDSFRLFEDCAMGRV